MAGRSRRVCVNINSVIGGGIRTPEDAVAVSRRALDLGFTSTLGIIDDGSGQDCAHSGRG